MSNRNPIKQWFITFPQCGDIKREQFADMFPPHEEVRVCMEEHDDGNPHLHMFIKLIKGLTKSKLLKWIKEKFPNDFKRINIQPVKNVQQVNDYINKEDPVPFVRTTKKVKGSAEEVDTWISILQTQIDHKSIMKITEGVRARWKAGRINDVDLYRYLDEEWKRIIETSDPGSGVEHETAKDRIFAMRSATRDIWEKMVKVSEEIYGE